MTHGFEREAFQEYEAAANYYAEQRSGLGEEFVQAVEKAVAAIRETPTRFQPVGEGLRIYRLRRFPYCLFYRFEVVRDHITVFAVMHNRRRPNYWKGRLSSGH
jgi:toxin ParE1/3/4